MGEGSHIYGTGRKSGSGRNRSRNTLNPADQRRRAAERLAQKSNINGGLSKAQELTVTRLENKIRDRKTEKAYVIDAKGNVVRESKTRSRYSARVTPTKDSVLIHNHPSAVHGDSTRVGSSLSGADISSIIYGDGKEVRAVGGQYTYSLRRPKNGWGADAATVRREWQAAYDRAKISNELHAFRGKDHNTRITRLQRMNSLNSHQATREMARKYGWEYTRKRTK